MARSKVTLQKSSTIEESFSLEVPLEEVLRCLRVAGHAIPADQSLRVDAEGRSLELDDKLCVSWRHTRYTQGDAPKPKAAPKKRPVEKDEAWFSYGEAALNVIEREFNSRPWSRRREEARGWREVGEDPPSVFDGMTQDELMPDLGDR